MPTGYTAKIADGIDFRTYAMDCARAFGACVTMRDDPGGGDMIPEKFEPSDWHAERLKEARAERARLAALSAAEVDTAAALAWEEAEEYRLKQLAEKRQLRSKYEAMLAEVNIWEPPTDEHTQFRDFMRDQITQSIDFDCGGSYGEEPEPKLSGEEWRKKMLGKADWCIQYHAKEDAGERERAASRTAWVAALRASLPT